MKGRVWLVGLVMVFGWLRLWAFSVSVPLLENWRYIYGDDPLYARVDYDDSSWKVVEFPTTSFSFEGESQPYTWLRKRCVIPDTLRGVPLGLYTGRIHDAVEIYLNGVLIGVSGSQPPRRYFGTPHTPRGFLLPPEIVRYGGENVIAIRVYTHKMAGAFGEMAIAFYHEVQNRVRLETILGLGIPQVVSIVSLFMLVYFLFLFIRTRDFASLFLGIGLVLMGLYYTDIYIEYLPIAYLLKQKIAFSGLYLSFVFYVLFFHRFYQLNRRPVEVVAAVAGVGSVIVNFFMPDFPTWELVMGTFVQLFWVLPVMIYILVVNGGAVIRKKPYAGLLFVGALFAVGFSLRDVFGFILRMWARYWMSSWGMLVFSVSMFMAMALRSADVERENKHKEEQLRRQKSDLETMVARMRDIAVELGETSQQLDNEIVSAKMAMEYVVDLSRQMREEFLHEGEALQESVRVTDQVAHDMASIMHRLEKENTLIQTGMKHFGEIVSSMRGMAGDIRFLREEMDKFKESIGTSREQTRVAREALQVLNQKAEKVFEVLGSIQRIADDTNTLAINAAIQSAHAGEYGKSFAIVGQEVRNLAMSVAHLADTVTTEVQQMNQELTGTQKHFDMVDATLQQTGQEMEKVDGILERFLKMIEDQEISARQVVGTVQELNGVVDDLLKSLGNQKERIEGFRGTLGNTQKVLQAFIQRLEAQTEKEQRVLEVMQRLKQLSQAHKTIVEKLSRVGAAGMENDLEGQKSLLASRGE